MSLLKQALLKVERNHRKETPDKKVAPNFDEFDSFDLAPLDAMPHGEMAHGEMAVDAPPHGEMTRGEMTQGEMTPGETPLGGTAHEDAPPDGFARNDAAEASIDSGQDAIDSGWQDAIDSGWENAIDPGRQHADDTVAAGRQDGERRAPTVDAPPILKTLQLAVERQPEPVVGERIKKEGWQWPAMGRLLAGTLALFLAASAGYFYQQWSSGGSVTAARSDAGAVAAPPLPLAASLSAASASLSTAASPLSPLSLPPSAATIAATTQPLASAQPMLAAPAAAPQAHAVLATPALVQATSSAAPPQRIANPIDHLPAVTASDGDTVQIRHGGAPHTISPALKNGYDALAANDLLRATEQYDMALKQDPNNRDALLGMAALARKRQDAARAGAYYARLLALDPDDADANAAIAATGQANPDRAGLGQADPGLAILDGRISGQADPSRADPSRADPGRADPGRAEAMLVEIIERKPDAAAPEFALGNLYAQQERWTDAQQAYFRAYTLAPANADYAYNVGVGLDRLKQPRLAADYYRRALAMHSAGAASFDATALRQRLNELDAASTGTAATHP